MPNWSKGGRGGLGCPARNAAGAVSSSPSRALPVLLPPPTPPTPQTASSTVPKGQLAKRGSRRRSLDARVTELVFVLFKKQIPNRAKPPYPRGIGKVAAGGRRGERE